MSRKSKILKAAQEIFEESKRNGAIAALSPSPIDLIDDVLQEDAIINAVSKGSMIDVGCGDGRWINNYIIQHPTGCAIGLDIDEGRLALAVQASNSFDVQLRSRVEYLLCDFASFDFKIASLVVVYLSRFGNDTVKSKILAECESGTVLVAVGVSCSSKFRITKI